MAQPKGRPELDLGEDPGNERRAWRVQRAGWVAMAAIVAAALSGLLGQGPASRHVVETPGMRIAFESPVRQRSSTSVAIRRAPAGGDEVAVTLDSAYVTDMRLQRVVPPPLRVQGGGGTTTFVFAARDGSLDAVFEFKPADFGVFETASRVAGSAPVRVRQVVLP